MKEIIYFVHLLTLLRRFYQTPCLTSFCIYLAVQCPQSTTNPSKPPTSSVSPSATSAVPMVKDVRLPKSLIPVHYDLRLQPEMYTSDPTNFIFMGKVAIDLNCTEATRTVVLHINMLNVSHILFLNLLNFLIELVHFPFSKLSIINIKDINIKIRGWSVKQS